MHFNFRCESDDVVVPEDGFDFGKVSFREIRAGIDGAIVYAADFERKRIGLRCDDKICAERCEFGGKAIADVERDAKRGGNDGHTEGECGKSQHLAARTASERVGDKAGEHG